MASGEGRFNLSSAQPADVGEHGCYGFQGHCVQLKNTFIHVLRSSSDSDDEDRAIYKVMSLQEGYSGRVSRAVSDDFLQRRCKGFQETPASWSTTTSEDDSSLRDLEAFAQPDNETGGEMGGEFWDALSEPDDTLPPRCASEPDMHRYNYRNGGMGDSDIASNDGFGILSEAVSACETDSCWDDLEDAPSPLPLCHMEWQASSTSDKQLLVPAFTSAQYSPENQNLQASSNFPEGQTSEEQTTVMMRNIPNNISRARVLQKIGELGFATRVDFVYLLCDFKKGANLGYAFVNLVNAEAACCFKESFDKFSNWESAGSTKVCECSWAEMQGLADHIERYRNSPVMHHEVPDEYKPVVFEMGVRVEFPPPTKRLRKPKMKASRLT
jgi:hypothetical protein